MPNWIGAALRAGAGSGALLLEHGADPGQQLAQLAGLGQVIVGAELEADDAVDRARSCGQHDDRYRGLLLELADDRKPVLLRHVEVEHDEIGRPARHCAPQAGGAVTGGRLEAVHTQIVGHHVARRCLVVDHDDVLALAHRDAATTGRLMMKAAPRPGPALSTSMWPPCNSTMRLTIESPSPVELSPPVGLAERR